MNKNLVLIGFMGTGKSTIGKILAKKLGRELVDVDQRIEEKEKHRISEIFEKRGESHFRGLEKEMIRRIAQGTNLVITTGGGAVLDPENVAALKAGGLLLALEADVATIWARVKDSRHRPLLKSAGVDEIRRLMEQRRPLYDQADLKFSTVGKSAAQVAEEILGSLGNEPEFEFGKDWF